MLALAWSPNGQYLATGDQDSTVHFWMVKTGEDLMMSGYPTKVKELSWDSSSRYLATGGGTMPCVWDCSGEGPANTMPQQFEAHTERVTVLALSAPQHPAGLRWGRRAGCALGRWALEGAARAGVSCRPASRRWPGP